MNIFHDLLNLFFPAICSTCESRLLTGEKYICIKCLASLPKTNYCRIEQNKLEEFIAGRFPFSRIASFAYFTQSGMLQQIIHELKYNNNPMLGIYIGKLCGDDLLKGNFLQHIDYLIPVPLHPKRLKQRGYNQALKIVKGMSEATKIPIFFLW